MAWSNIAGNATGVSGTAFADIPTNGTTIPVTLTPGEAAAVQIEADFPTTPTDNLNYQILGSSDGGTTWDTTPLAAGQLDNATDPHRFTVLLWGVHVFKVQAAASGTTDTITVTVRTALDGVSQ